MADYGNSMVTRAQHRRATLLQISDAAIDLFALDGSDVTFDAVAARAELSRRTLFRYVTRKEELAFIHPVLWLDVFNNALQELQHLALPDRLQIASRAIAHYIDDDPERPRRAFEAVSMRPELAPGFASISQRWIDRIADEVLQDIDESTSTDRFRARIIGSAVMGMVDAVTREWVAATPTTKFVDLYDLGFKVLAPIIDDA